MQRLLRRFRRGNATVGSLSQVSPSAYLEACAAAENAAATMACILEKGRADQLGRRQLARSDVKGGALGVLARADAD